MRAAVTRAGHEILWLLKQATGEARWDEHLDRCHRQGTEPMSRRDFERHRADHAERNPQSRCC